MSAKKSKKQRKFGRWSRGGKAALRKLRIERNKAAKLARYAKWLAKRRRPYGGRPVEAAKRDAYVALVKAQWATK